MKNTKFISISTLIVINLLLTSCASLDFFKEKFSPSQTVADTKVADKWQMDNGLPHNGELKNLQSFWMQYQDPLLLELIEAAQSQSATVATAKANITQARANRVGANSALLPTLDGTASASRGVQQPTLNYGTGTGSFDQPGGITNSAQIGAEAAWELDIFGANRALLNAAKASENAATANWHEARVSVAAEVATSYFNQRFCEMQLVLSTNDAKSRAETMRVTEISAHAGFTATGEAALASGSAADALQVVKAQQTQCDLEVKSLVALTNLGEQNVREKLKQIAFNANEENKALFSIAEIPAEVIAQRPDIYSAEVDLINAAAEVKNTQAQRLPKVSLNGSIGWMRLTGDGYSGDGEIWSLGPISIRLPIFDGGKRKANVDSAEAKYEEAAAKYRSKVRYAVKEVESALVNLHSAEIRQADIERSISAYKKALSATQEKVKAGFANLLELEESRRYALQAETNRVNLLKERNNAWISLYRAAGGGWDKALQTNNEQNNHNATSSK